jgi:hypothetical protein
LLTSKHDRQASNDNVSSSYNLATTNIFNVDIYVCGIRQVAQTTFVRSIAFVGTVCICSLGNTDFDIAISNTMCQTNKSYRTTKESAHSLEVKVWINVGCYTFIRLDNLFQVDIDKVVERVDMLFDKTFDFEKSRQKFPFVLRALWIG